MRFTWDRRKAAGNAKKHKVTFEEAESAVQDPHARRRTDGAHDDGRELVIGESKRNRVLVVVLIEIVDGEVTRIISARRATNHERRRYEEGMWEAT